MRFNLDYLTDNGTLKNWPTATELDCQLVQWRDDKCYSVLDAQGKPIGYGDDIHDALWEARLVLTDRRRKADGIIPAKVC